LDYISRQAEELKLERQNEQLAESSICAPAPKVLSYEEALLRNTNTLKVSHLLGYQRFIRLFPFPLQALEIAKARLRSRSTYSPVEKLLQQALQNYRRELESLQDAEDRGKDPKNPDNQEEEGEEGEEENLYDLVMQNVMEAKRQQTDL